MEVCKTCNRTLYYDSAKGWRHNTYVNDRGERIMIMTRCYEGPWETTPKAEPKDSDA